MFPEPPPPHALAELAGMARAGRPELEGEPAEWFLAGWDSVALGLGPWLFKFPRNATAEAALRREVALLALIAPATSVPVPRPVLVETPRLHSMHRRLEGRHLLGADYAGLGEAVRDRLARDLARLFADLHRLDPSLMRAAGAAPVAQWSPPEEIVAAALPLLPAPLRNAAAGWLHEYATLPPDPLGEVYGHFDAHGWNMAFDHAEGRLCGVYDFGDSGIGPLHREFALANFISPDLTKRIIRAYAEMTGRRVERRRVALTYTTLILDEIAGAGAASGSGGEMLDLAIGWVRHFNDTGAG